MVGHCLCLPLLSPFFIGCTRDFVLDFSQRVAAEECRPDHCGSVFCQFVGPFVTGVFSVRRNPDKSDPGTEIRNLVNCFYGFLDCFTLYMRTAEGSDGRLGVYKDLYVLHVRVPECSEGGASHLDCQDLGLEDRGVCRQFDAVEG